MVGFCGSWMERTDFSTAFPRSNARRVVNFNPLDKSFTEIRSDLDLTSVRVNASGGVVWCGMVWCGVRANNGKHLLRTFYTAACDKVQDLQWYNSPLTIGKMKYSTTNPLLSSY